MAATWPVNPAVVPVRRGLDQINAEARIQTILLCRIATLLSQMAGPTNVSVPGNTEWTAEDLTAEIDSWRADPSIMSN